MDSFWKEQPGSPAGRFQAGWTSNWCAVFHQFLEINVISPNAMPNLPRNPNLAPWDVWQLSRFSPINNPLKHGPGFTSCGCNLNFAAPSGTTSCSWRSTPVQCGAIHPNVCVWLAHTPQLWPVTHPSPTWRIISLEGIWGFTQCNSWHFTIRETDGPSLPWHQDHPSPVDTQV